MYAIIRAGGKQYKVAPGDVIDIERVKETGGSLEFTPLLVVDDNGGTHSAKGDLARARVTASVLGEAKGPKVDIVKYRNKSGYRRHLGHRQKYTTIQIGDINLPGSGSTTRRKSTRRSGSDETAGASRGPADRAETAEAPTDVPPAATSKPRRRTKKSNETEEEATNDGT